MIQRMLSGLAIFLELIIDIGGFIPSLLLRAVFHFYCFPLSLYLHTLNLFIKEASQFYGFARTFLRVSP